LISEDEMRRLAFARHLYNIGVEQSRRPQPFSAVAILHFHDAVELFLHMAAEHFGENTNNVQFMQYWDRIEPHLSGHRLAERESMRRLNMMRVNLKHHNNYPAPLSIEGSRASVTSFFEMNTPLVFDIEFTDVSMLNLVEYQETRARLEVAERLMQERKVDEAITESAVAFAALMDAIEAKLYKRYGRSPFSFGSPVILGNLIGGVPSAYSINPTPGRFAQELAFQVHAELEKVQRAMKPLTMGLDYRRFARFQLLTPHVWKAIGRDEYMSDATTRDEPFTLEESRFCFDFVIESALHLQEFDF